MGLTGINWTAIQNVGAATLMFILLFVLLKWVFKNQDRILTMANEQNKQWLNVTEGLKDSINKHTNHAREFQVVVKEAHKHQREEHKEMCDVFGDVKDAIVENTAVLKTMNGHSKKD